MLQHNDTGAPIVDKDSPHAGRMGTVGHLMRPQDDESRAHVRPAWLKAVVDASQRIAGDCQQIDPDDTQHTFRTFLQALPAARGPVERLILRAVLLEVAWRCGEIMHARAKRCGDDCSFLPAAILDRFWGRGNQDPRQRFLNWVDAFSAEFTRTHPPSAASQAARAIQQHYERPWSVADLARRFGVTPSYLRRTFRREFGASIRQYQRTMRLIEAMAQLPTGKIDAVALQVGYKSKKNFYRAF